MPHRQKHLPLRIVGLSLIAALSPAFSPALMAAEAPQLEEVLVWGTKKSSKQAGYTSPISLLTPDDLESINAATTEDLIKYEPSLVIRRRFIGDANGTMGIRGSNMFQTSRSMVFADGVPLHYLLESRWNGAPRWTMVSASEIAQVEVVYGPFSAEYSGNAMGGVVLIETAIPQQREFHVDVGYFAQQFDDYGFDDTVSGYKSFISYGDRLGDLSVYASYNHLQNESQPQSFFYGDVYDDSPSATNPTAVNGAIPGNDERSNPRLFFGDTGVVDTGTRNYKLKAGYEFGDWFALFNLAYEDRLSQSDSANSYLRDGTGKPVWSGNVTQDGQTFSVPSSRLNVSEQERQSLSLGLRVKGPITDTLELEANLNQFTVLHDRTVSSATHPRDPAYDATGQLRDYGDTGWRTVDFKLTFTDLGVNGLDLSTGLRHEAYELNLDGYASDNHLTASKDAFDSRSGGETAITALFAQLNWVLNSRWDLSLGGRFEHWQSRNGYYSADEASTPAFELRRLPARSDEHFSPKFSLGYHPAEQWTLRYSLAKAYRFPIVEELFSQYQAFNAVNEANPELKPEEGLHHNLMLERSLARGYLRLNLFQESIENVIESQAATLPGGSSLRTFIPVDEVEVRGIELVANVVDVLPKLDLRINLANTHAQIIKNRIDPTIEGNTFPRMPKWRGNLLATYHVSDKWNLGSSLQYASDSYGRTDNADDEDKVYDAQDAYTRLGVKTNYRFNAQASVSLGIDNLSNEIAYVAHPWPGRTYYVNAAYDF